MENRNGFIVFSDINGFSKMNDEDLKKFYSIVWVGLMKEIGEIKKSAAVFNTWGDAIVAVFFDGNDAVKFLLKLRNYFRQYPFSKIGLDKRLIPRIAGHMGEFGFFDDPLLEGRKNIVGTSINTTARMEPVTRPGDIFVSKEFKDAVGNTPNKKQIFQFSEVGVIKLAKGFGQKLVYRLYTEEDREQHMERLIEYDLSFIFPNPPVITIDEKEDLNNLKLEQDLKRFKECLNAINSENYSAQFLIELAEICKNRGLYLEALAFINFIEKFAIQYKEKTFEIHPYSDDYDLMKLKANCLTRLGRYNDAYDTIYRLWILNKNDNDLICMMAAQYKRKAFYGNGKFHKINIVTNNEMLNTAINLYQEAFRRNISDYYAVINIAYLYAMNSHTEDKGIQMAKYLLATWSGLEDEGWWLHCTIAEAYMIANDIKRSVLELKKAIKNHKPDSFMKNTVLEQIALYSKVKNFQGEVKPIIELLNSIDIS